MFFETKMLCGYRFIYRLDFFQCLRDYQGIIKKLSVDLVVDCEIADPSSIADISWYKKNNRQKYKRIFLAQDL